MPPVGKGAFPSNESLSANLGRLENCGFQICSYPKDASKAETRTQEITAYCYTWKSKKKGRIIRHNGFDEYPDCRTVRNTGGYLSEVTSYIGSSPPRSHRAEKLGNGVSTLVATDPVHHFKFWFENGILMVKHGHYRASSYVLQKAKVRTR
jgi:hypothetical protein